MEVLFLLTNKELMLIQDNIKMCQNTVNFTNSCAQGTTDSQLKAVCQTIASSSQRDIQTLSNYIINQNLQ